MNAEQARLLKMPHQSETVQEQGELVASGMDSLLVRGGNALEGRIAVSGAKNAALPLMCAALLSDAPLHLDNMPMGLGDLRVLSLLLGHFGVDIEMDEHAMKLNAGNASGHIAPYDLVRRMRASILTLGPLTARMGQAHVALPGGCAIGTRPVNLHIDGLRAMGAEVEIEEGYIVARAPQGLKGARFRFPKVSVTGTENLMMAASLADGVTVIENAACEPEVVDLGICLQKMGVPIKGLGSPMITIEGVKSLKEARHSVIPDRIEAGTFMIAAVMTGGDMLIESARLRDLEALKEILIPAGAQIVQNGADIRVLRGRDRLRPMNLETAPHPGFPTDLQAQMMALMTQAEGQSQIAENIFENRYMHASELMRMGADITLDGSIARVRGPSALKAAPVVATDLRASVALVLAGLVAEGATQVQRIYHLDRGYENLTAKLAACGADIQRVQPSDIKDSKQKPRVST